MDRRGAGASQDFGLRLDGPLFGVGNVRYAVMYANDSAAQPERDRNKRVYGRLSATPTESVTLGGGDYTEFSDRRLRLSASSDYTTDRVRVGGGGLPRRHAPHGQHLRPRVGASLFGHVQLTRTWGLVARLDWTTQLLPATDPLGFDPVESLLLAGITYNPHPNVEVIPNVWIRNSNRYSQSDTLLRLTLDLSF